MGRLSVEDGLETASPALVVEYLPATSSIVYVFGLPFAASSLAMTVAAILRTAVVRLHEPPRC